MAAVYKITIGNIFYYGSSVQVKTRRATHIRHLKQQTHGNRVLQRAYNKHQEFVFEIIEECKPELVRQAEQRWIDLFFNHPRNANLCSTTNNPMDCPIQKKKLADRNRARSWSDESRRKLSKAHKGHQRMTPDEKLRRGKMYAGSGNPNAKIKAHHEAIIRQMTIDGATQKHMARELSVGVEAVRRAQKRMGISAANVRVWSEDRREHMSRLMKKQGSATRLPLMSGEKSSSSKLTIEEVLAIRAALPHTRRGELARKYGVCTSTISQIATRHTWKHI